MNAFTYHPTTLHIMVRPKETNNFQRMAAILQPVTLQRSSSLSLRSRNPLELFGLPCCKISQHTMPLWPTHLQPFRAS